MGVYYSIPEDTYIAIQNYVIGVYRENYPGGLIPVENVEGLPYTHRIPYFEDYDVSKGGVDWTAEQIKADAKLQYLDVDIFLRQMKLAWSPRELRRMGDKIINAKTQAIVKKFLDEVDFALWQGNTEGDIALNSGILAQATTVEDLDGTDSALVAAAGLMAGMIKMVTSMPVKYRSLPLVMGMDWTFYDLIASKYITDMVTVVDAFKKAYPEITLVRNNKAFLIDGTDTAGTHSRLMLFPQDINIIRNVKAKEVGPVAGAQVDLTGGVEQLWGTMFAPKVVFADAVLLSEQITYADA